MNIIQLYAAEISIDVYYESVCCWVGSDIYFLLLALSDSLEKVKVWENVECVDDTIFSRVITILRPPYTALYRF